MTDPTTSLMSRHSRTMSGLAVLSVLGLTLGACSSNADAGSETTATAEVTETATPSAETEQPEPEETEASEEGQDDESSGDAGDTETFTSQGGTFSFEVPADWSAETVEYNPENAETQGVPDELIVITSPKGDIEINVSAHTGPTSGDGWRSRHWQVADVEELTDLPLHEQHDHNYFRTDEEWLGEDDAEVDPGSMGWNSDDYRLISKVVSQSEEVTVGDDDFDLRQNGWSYWTPLPADWAGETTFISVIFSQELIEGLTGETGQEEAVPAFLENEWYQTTRDILTSVQYEEPAEDDLPLTE